ncbi:MAG: hypothetical protein ABID54_04225 [Pseudomonadota bacterium]
MSVQIATRSFVMAVIKNTKQSVLIKTMKFNHTLCIGIFRFGIEISYTLLQPKISIWATMQGRRMRRAMRKIRELKKDNHDKD